MIGNPEFTRNLWIQFTATRVLVAGLLTGLLLACAAAVDFALASRRGFTPDITVFVARWLAIAILLLWAGRQAAGAVLREIRGRTWDAQRLSTLHPWSMAWGKLFGTTSLAWTMALVCAAAYLGAAPFLRPQPRPLDAALVTLAGILGYGLVCQATGLLASLARLSGRPGERGGGTTLAHAVGLVAVALLGGFVVWALQNEARWFGLAVGESAIRLVTIWFFALWAVIGVYRRMRRELQMRSVPWAWLLFLVSFVVYGEGLGYGRGVPQAALLLPAGLVALMLWTMTLIEAKDPLTLKQTFAACRRGRWARAASLVPLWLVTYAVFAAVAAGGIAAAAAGAPELGVLRIRGESPADTILILAAAFLFVTRDVLIVQSLMLGRESGLAGLTGAVSWFVLYVAVPAVFVAGQQTRLLGLVLPTGQGGWAICLLSAGAQALLCLVLVVWRWRSYWRENAAKAPTA